MNGRRLCWCSEVQLMRSDWRFGLCTCKPPTGTRVFCEAEEGLDPSTTTPGCRRTAVTIPLPAPKEKKKKKKKQKKKKKAAPAPAPVPEDEDSNRYGDETYAPASSGLTESRCC
jgi:hypothetical protein